MAALLRHINCRNYYYYYYYYFIGSSSLPSPDLSFFHQAFVSSFLPSTPFLSFLPSILPSTFLSPVVLAFPPSLLLQFFLASSILPSTHPPILLCTLLLTILFRPCLLFLHLSVHPSFSFFLTSRPNHASWCAFKAPHFSLSNFHAFSNHLRRACQRSSSQKGSKRPILFVSDSQCLSVCLPVCLYTFVCICLSVYLCLCHGRCVSVTLYI